jgi:hypothetical protein
MVILRVIDAAESRQKVRHLLPHTVWFIVE